ncbi:MAG: hypothetical protein ABIR25_06690 [Sphingomicrobium sp.]
MFVLGLRIGLAFARLGLAPFEIVAERGGEPFVALLIGLGHELYSIRRAVRGQAG